MSLAIIPDKHTESRLHSDGLVDDKRLSEIIEEVSDVIAPVWPLRDYVAVNPYAGIANRNFLEARSFLRVFSDCESLMPLGYYAAEFQRGAFLESDIATAISESQEDGSSLDLSADEIVGRLMAVLKADKANSPTLPAGKWWRPIRTFAEYATTSQGLNWTEVIVDEISKYCSAHYDKGQAIWSSPFSNFPLYQAWRSAALHDRNIEILGLDGFRRLVQQLPHTPEAAIVHLLTMLDVPVQLWSAFLLSQAFSIPGWCAWTKYHSDWCSDRETEWNDLTALLAIRLAYDVALSKTKAISVDWSTLSQGDTATFATSSRREGDDSVVRSILLRASEISYRRQLVQSLSLNTSAIHNRRKRAQMVFCIDVRSERLRRQLESCSSDIETFGFAGFFGVGFRYQTLGDSSGSAQLPVLLQPKFIVHQGSKTDDTNVEMTVLNSVLRGRSWLSLWKNLKSASVSCFSYVEAMGLFSGLKLIARLMGAKLPDPMNPPESEVLNREALGPRLRGLSEQGIDAGQQVELAEGMLRNLGLTKDFARLVVFCGHACQTENNPLAAGLDCGACGGHSGEPNARFAALLLNQESIRQGLRQKGIEIPDDTRFIAALHNTTTDEVCFFDRELLPKTHERDWEELIESCSAASHRTRVERLSVVESTTVSDLLKRATNWSEVRPEWGLAGNSAFVAAPRSMTQNANLDARVFLHSYDYRQDQGGHVLETIMTAPMIVANWINMQYYASTVDNRYFGSGNKTVHNVVGKFGILSGNSGDLQTGLPWQSLHTGRKLQHLPMRLQVVIAAPTAMINRVIDKHESVANLLNNQWVHLLAIEGEQVFRYCGDCQWGQLSDTSNDSRSQLETETEVL